MRKLALISASDKTGLSEFARRLVDLGYSLVATTGTKRYLAESGVTCRDVSDISGIAEIAGGRVKSLHHNIFAGILFDRSSADQKDEARRFGFPDIALVVANFYPFRPGVDPEEAVALTDIGGPAMVRAAAKNHRDVVVVVDPKDYQFVAEKLASGMTILDRRRLAAKVFELTSNLDRELASFWLRNSDSSQDLGEKKVVGERLRYGENPWQSAELQLFDGSVPMEQISGKELSYNNYLDLDAAYRCIRRHQSPAAVIIKHASPCGFAADTELNLAFTRARAGDPRSAFGGVIGLNQPVDEVTAREIATSFFECVLAPAFTTGAREILSAKKALRLIVMPDLDAGRAALLDHRSALGRVLVQQGAPPTGEWRVVSEKKPTVDIMRDLNLAWRVVHEVRSNGVVLLRNGQTIGIGGGQTSRIGALEVAVSLARQFDHLTQQSVLASDGFFPFPDCVALAAKNGVTAIVQPGGSKMDQASIDEANANGLVMAFTGYRAFRH